jgi:hypothetical protein
MPSVCPLRTAVVAASAALVLLATCAAAAPPAPPKAAAPKESPALYGMGAQPCKAFVDVSGEKDNREIALSGAMFSWAQGWFSARNVIGHENAPRTVGGTLSAERLKSLLVDECRSHPDEAIYLAVNNLYQTLASKGL